MLISHVSKSGLLNMPLRLKNWSLHFPWKKMLMDWFGCHLPVSFCVLKKYIATNDFTYHQLFGNPSALEETA